jgi:hypothetical protein
LKAERGGFQNLSFQCIATQAATSHDLTPDRIAAFVDLVRQKIETAAIQARKKDENWVVLLSI